MESLKKTIATIELNNIMGKRVSLDPNTPQIIVKDKIIDQAINLSGMPLGNPGTYIADVFFSNCIFSQQINLGKYINAGKITFENCEFEKNVTIDSLSNAFFIGSRFFKQDLTISIDSQKNLISDFTVEGILTVNGSTNGKLSINNINIQKNIFGKKFVLNVKCKQLEIFNLHVDEFTILDFSMDNGSYSLKKISVDKFILKDLVFRSPLNIQNSAIWTFEVESILGDRKELVINDACYIKSLTIPLSKFSKVDIADCKIDKLFLSDINYEGNILNIQNLTTKEFVFDNVYNKGLIVLRGLRLDSESKLSIKSSNLGKCDFIHCDFSKSMFEFENSKISEAFLSETEFPETVFLDYISNPIQSQLAFGQLASAFKNQGDTVRALEYQSREIEAHYNGLDWNENFFTAFNLFLNKYSNNFGRNWQRGLLFSLIVGAIIFYLLVISSKEYSFGFRIDFDTRFFSAFLKFMNPLRFFDPEALFKINQENSFLKLTSMSYFLDFLGRIFIAYGFYQTIQAFRRFGRK